MPLYFSGSLNIPTGSVNYNQDLTGYETFTGSLDIITEDEGFRTHGFFGYTEVNRIQLKNSYPPSIKNTKVVWIMRGVNNLDGVLFTWRNPDTPDASHANVPIREGTLKVLGYFYED